MKVKHKIFEGNISGFQPSIEQRLFRDDFIYAIILDFEVHALVYNEAEHEQYISIGDQRLVNKFEKRVRIENNWFILTVGRVQNTQDIIFDGDYKLTYLYFI